MISMVAEGFLWGRGLWEEGSLDLKLGNGSK